MKFSIITVCYNSEKTIQRTIDSVLAQTYQDYEYIIVDGKSKDNTVQIIKDAEPLFKGKLRWISEPDTGIYNAMNKGIAMATGEIVGIINSDDWYSPDALEKVINVVSGIKLNNSIFCGDMMFHYLDGTAITSTFKKDIINNRIKKLYMFLNHPSTFIPMSVYNKFGTYDENYVIIADADLALRCYFAGVNFIPVHAVLAHMAEGGLTSSSKADKRIINDKKILFSKYASSKFDFLIRLTYVYMKYFIKTITPTSLIKAIKKVKIKTI